MSTTCQTCPHAFHVGPCGVFDVAFQPRNTCPCVVPERPTCNACGYSWASMGDVPPAQLKTCPHVLGQEHSGGLEREHEHEYGVTGATVYCIDASCGAEWDLPTLMASPSAAAARRSGRWSWSGP